MSVATSDHFETQISNPRRAGRDNFGHNFSFLLKAHMLATFSSSMNLIPGYFAICKFHTAFASSTLEMRIKTREQVKEPRYHSDKDWLSHLDLQRL